MHKFPPEALGGLSFPFRAFQYLLVSSRPMWPKFELMINFVSSKSFFPVLDFGID